MGDALRRTIRSFVLLVAILTITPGAASQVDDTGGSETEPPPVEAPPREWATLDVTVAVQDNLTDDLGLESQLPVTVTNNGNIPAAGVVAVVEGGRMLAGKPVEVGDIPPGTTVNLDLPFDILGRSTFPVPFAVRLSAKNISQPSVTTVEQTFSGLTTDDYLPVLLDADLLLEQRYDRYDGGFARPQPLLWLESREKLVAAPLVVDLSPLLTGDPPKDLILSVLRYADEDKLPEPLEAKYDPDLLLLTFTPPGDGRYLIEWSRPLPKTDADEDTPARAITVTEPELPQGWTPTYHAPLVSEFNGSVSFSYPILTPPGPAGLQPNLGLSYSSANGNGLIGRLQADEVGFGWTNTALIDVTQSLKTCNGDDICETPVDLDGNPGGGTYNQYTLSFNGAGHELVHSAGKAGNGLSGRYYAQGNPGLYVELCKAPFSAYCAFSGTNINTQSDVFWRIKSADNTTYRLGFTTNSEQELRFPAQASSVDNKALRWRVDTVTNRFGSVMTYTYLEDTYSGWVHPEYFHAPSSYPTTITYGGYTVNFGYQWVPNSAYRDQGYGYVVSWHTRYLSDILVSWPGQQIRRYALGYDWQRYGTDNDTGDPPIPNQSTWCADFDWVLDFNDPGNPDDNIKYTPDKLPMLVAIHEFGSTDTAKSSQADTTFSYSFLGTGEYDHANAPAHVRYCSPYMTSVETIYGPADPNTPTTAYVWRATQQSYQAAGSYPNTSVLSRWANLVEKETTYSGFAADAPDQNVWFRYTTPDMQGNEDTFQGFITVDRCRDAACTGAWAAKETLTFLTQPYHDVDAALTGRLSIRNVYKAGGALMARTENTWAMLDEDGVPGEDPSLAAVLTQSIQRD
ncbi:MAG TPA: hypothetical protein VF434_13310, partial [Promineifilum sp.]